MPSAFMSALLASRSVFQNTQIQPMKASVQKPEYKARNIALWSKSAAAIHATTNMLSVPVWGSTKPTDFITISGEPPKTPVIISVPTIAGSNMIQGGLHNGS